MSNSLIISLIGVSLLLFLIITFVLKKGRIPEKYALLWYAMDLIILLVVIFHSPLSIIAKELGFYPWSIFVLSIFIGILFLLVIALTVMMAGQKKKTTLLVQEISILKSKVNNLEGRVKWRKQ